MNLPVRMMTGLEFIFLKEDEEGRKETGRGCCVTSAARKWQKGNQRGSGQF